MPNSSLQLLPIGFTLVELLVVIAIIQILAAFTLYSVGWNEKDDGGKPVMNPQDNGTDPAQGDWVWPTWRQD